MISWTTCRNFQPLDGGNPKEGTPIRFSNILNSAAETCPFCRQKAGILASTDRDCQETFQTGWTEMVNLAAEAARTHNFDEKPLRLTLAEIARKSYGDGTTANQAPEVEDQNQKRSLGPASRYPATRPGLPRTPIPDSASENTTTTAISADTHNSCRTAQHGIGEVESAKHGRRRPDF